MTIMDGFLFGLGVVAAFVVWFALWFIIGEFLE